MCGKGAWRRSNIGEIAIELNDTVTTMDMILPKCCGGERFSTIIKMQLFILAKPNVDVKSPIVITQWGTSAFYEIL